MKNFTLLTSLFVLFIAFQSFTSSSSLAWKEVYNQNDIVVSYQMKDCNGAQVLLFKMDNNTGNDKMISFSFDVMENGQIEMQGLQFEEFVGAGQSFECTCPNRINSTSKLFVLPRDINAPDIKIEMH